MFGLSLWEVGMILMVALLVLGPRRLPGLIQSVGKTLRMLRRASSDLRVALDEPLREVREPLEEIRNDILGTVHHFERQVHEATDAAIPRPDDALGPPQRPALEAPEAADRAHGTHEERSDAPAEDAGAANDRTKE